MSASRDFVVINLKSRFSSQQMNCLYEKQRNLNGLQIISHIQVFNQIYQKTYLNLVLLLIPVASIMESGYTEFIIKKIKICYRLNHNNVNSILLKIFTTHFFLIGIS